MIEGGGMASSNANMKDFPHNATSDIENVQPFLCSSVAY